MAHLRRGRKATINGVPYPEPSMNWEPIRLAKLRCEKECADKLGLKAGDDLPSTPVVKQRLGIR